MKKLVYSPDYTEKMREIKNKEVGEVLLERRLRRGSVMYTRHLIDTARGFGNAYLKVTSMAEKEETGPEDREMLIKHSERQIFYSLLFYLSISGLMRKSAKNAVPYLIPIF